MRKIILLLSVCALLCGCKEQSAEKKFTRNNDIIQNPGQGWMSIGRKMDPKLPYGSRYVRFHWKSLEPEEGKYNWEPIDKEIERAEKLGIPFSFRVMCASAHSATPYASPEWVFKGKGAKFAMFKNDPNGDSSTGDTRFERVTPIFEDPVFIKLHARFIKALAERYDGDPRISTIDIGSYGNWGEWHTFGLGIKPAPLEVRKQYADMYLNNFKKTDLVFMTDDAVVLKYAIGDGEGSRVGLRRDGVGGEGHYDHWIGKGKYLKAGVTKMGDVWKYKPMLFEWYVCYPDMLKRKWPLPKAVDFILSNHASLVSENLRPSSVPAEEYAQVEKISRGVGARIFVDAAKAALGGGKLKVSLEGENGGIARISLPYELVYELRAPDGKTAATFVSKADPTKWLPGKISASDEFELPKNLPEGKYELVARLAHKNKIFHDFKFAANEASKDGSISLGEFAL